MLQIILLLTALLGWQGPAIQPVSYTQSQPVSSSAGIPNRHCGAESLYFALKYLDLPVNDYPQVVKQLGPPGPMGYSMAQLDAAAQAFGAKTLGVETSLEALADRQEPVVRIAHMDSKHFVTILGEEGDMVRLVNPPAQEVKLPRSVFLKMWQGKTLLVSSTRILKPAFSVGTMPLGVVFGIVFGAFVSILAFLKFRSPKVS